jgi:hypothetical protein
MNDAEFENHLRNALRPVAPSAELRERIREELPPPATAARAYAGRLPRPQAHGFWKVLLRDFGWACAGAAAALAVLALWPSRQTPVSVPTLSTGTGDLAVNTKPSTPATGANTFEHDETTNELVSSPDIGALVETNDGPAREVRYTYLERQEWSNPHTGARVYLEVPREDVYFVPVSLQ